MKLTKGSCVVLGFTDPGHELVVWRSTDGGTTWQDQSGAVWGSRASGKPTGRDGVTHARRNMIRAAVRKIMERDAELLRRLAR